MKHGQVWISAVLYMALGVVILTIVLAAGMPVINKMKDKNAILQTKDVLNIVNKNIRSAYTQGPGSQRAVKIEIGRGSLKVDVDLNTISWDMETKVAMSEPGVIITEGDLIIETEATSVENKYITHLKLDYLGDADSDHTLDLISTTDIKSLEGTNNLLIFNKGDLDGDGDIHVDIQAI